MNPNEFYINRCLQLAKMGFPAAAPNPSVGAVVVFENKIIGEGFTSAYGGNHAEVNAILTVKNKLLLSKSTLYVSLEPCSHFGKTPPCADLIIRNKIPKVVIGIGDSHEKVAGAGIQKLRDAGVEVQVGVLEKECWAANKRFFTFLEKKRPYIVLKWAESLDGFIAPSQQVRGQSVAISNQISRQLAHKFRSENQAILVGTHTVLMDNPKLNVRNWTGKNPVRIVLDRTRKIDNAYFVTDLTQKTIVITEQKKIQSIDNLLFEYCIFDQHLFENVCSILQKHKIQSVLVEGGAQTLQGFIDANLWDECHVFKTDTVFKSGVAAPKIKYENVKKTTVLNDQLVTSYNHD